MFSETTGSGGGEGQFFWDRALQRLFHGKAVDNRLQRGASADHHSRRCPVASGLVIGDAELLRAALCLDHVDRSAQQEAPVNENRVLLASLVASFILEAK